MQLNPPGEPRCLRSGLALAVAGLLGARAAAAGDTAATELGSGILVYSEPGRVSALEAVVVASKGFAEQHRVQLRIVYDTLTGASPNGAVPARIPQTFTRPSGAGSYRTEAGETPLDDTFRDTRFAGSLGYDRPFLSVGRWNLGLQGSSEHDYLSVGGSTGMTWEFDRKNTVLALGLSGSRDEISPEGGIPTSFAEMPAATGEHEGDAPRRGSEADAADGTSETKTVFDAVLGLTQVVDRTTLVRCNYSISTASGYLEDPYKFLSVLVAPDAPNAGDPVTYVYEDRPDRRTKHSLFAEARKRIAATTLDLSYRYLWDDWGVVSHTAEVRERIPLGEAVYLEPHLRYYHQTAADFHRAYLVEATALPTHASADPRLTAMTALTLGSRCGGFRVGHQEFAITLEYYRQFLEDGDEPVYGSLAGLDLSEDVGAFMLRLSHGFEP